MATFDVSMPIRPSMPTFPGDPPVLLEALQRVERGDAYSLSVLTLGTHAGTHIDPPSHFLPAGATLDELDLGLLNGPCELVRIADGQSSVFPADVDRIPAGTERVVFRTLNSARWARGEEYFADFVDVSPSAARALVARGVRLVGIDALSVESDPTLSFPVHRALLAAGTAILEGLLLDAIVEGPYELRCLPIRIEGGDGGPCRALLISP